MSAAAAGALLATMSGCACCGVGLFIVVWFILGFVTYFDNDSTRAPGGNGS